MRVFNNLLKNAQQAIPEDRAGRVEVLLRSTTRRPSPKCATTAPASLKRTASDIFRPNFTTKSSGMGLGLAMVKRMVESAGGRVWFESREGAGTASSWPCPVRK
jgi:signal transduction histidine kinase